jgi:hypothetical protein
MRNMAKKNIPPNIVQLAGAIIFLVIFESVLVIAGILPPVMSYSLGNVVFAGLRLAIIAYAGTLILEGGMMRAAKQGAILGFASSFTLCLLTIVCKSFFNIAILGISVPSQSYLYIVLAISVLANSLLGAIVAAVSYFIAKLVVKKSK